MRITTLALLMLAVVGVAGAQQKRYVVQPFGEELRNENVFGIDTAGPRIYVAADTAGIYMYDSRMDGPNTWHHVGLKGKHCQAVAAAPASAGTLLVAVDRRPGETTPRHLIYRSDDLGQTWTASQTGIDTIESEVAIVRRLEFNPGDPSEVVAIIQGTGTYISRDTGRTWSRIPGLDGLTLNDIAWDRTRPGTIFVGGENMILNAILLKSTDGGATWRSTLDVNFHGDNAIDAIAINPNDPDMMVAGTEGFFLRSTNAGENWTATLEPGRYYMYGAVWSNRDPETVFITGGNHFPQSGGIYVSGDEGRTWDLVDSNRWRTVQRAIVSENYPGVLFFTAGHYIGPEDGGLPGGVFIVTDITARVPTAPAGASVWQSNDRVHLRATAGRLRWELVDPLGRTIDNGTVDEGGTTTVDLDALASGIYLLRYQDRSGVSTSRIRRYAGSGM
jgi:photosystem II stability/assembly factor-like uncharacterized protein